jgi:hypothetical protein
MILTRGFRRLASVLGRSTNVTFGIETCLQRVAMVGDFLGLGPRGYLAFSPLALIYRDRLQLVGPRSQEGGMGLKWGR